MSDYITDAFVQQYSANIFHLSQQKGSRLRPLVRQESQRGKAAFYDRLASVAAVKRTTRHGDTPIIATQNSRRMVSMDDYEWGDLIDDQDKIRMLIDPTSEYVVAAMWAFGRSMDDEIIAAQDGNAYSGETGTTSVAQVNGQYYAANDGTNFTNLNVATLRAVKAKFDANDVDESEPRYFAYTSSQLQSLLGQTQVTSSDYNSVKALVEGHIDTFMGFKFVRTERLLTVVSGSASSTTGAYGSGSSVAGYRRCFAWAKMGLLLSIGEDMTARVSERADKGYATQAYARMSVGATRMEEVKVVTVICNES